MCVLSNVAADGYHVVPHEIEKRQLGALGDACKACHLAFNFIDEHFHLKEIELKFIELMTKWCKPNVPFLVRWGCELLGKAGKTLVVDLLHNFGNANISCPLFGVCQQQNAVMNARHRGLFQDVANWAKDGLCKGCRKLVNAVFDMLDHDTIRKIFQKLHICKVLVVKPLVNACNKKDADGTLAYPNINDIIERNPDMICSKFMSHCGGITDQSGPVGPAQPAPAPAQPQQSSMLGRLGSFFGGNKPSAPQSPAAPPPQQQYPPQQYSQQYPQNGYQ